MKIRKAVITAAGPSQRSLPLQTLADRDGVEKPVLRIIVEEALRAGVEEIAIVVAPGDETAYARVAGDHAGRLCFVPQPEPLGYGHAVLCARGFVSRDPFLHLVGDHLYISRTEKSCAQQLVEVAEAHACAVSAVQATRENLLPHYGAAGGQRVAGSQDLYRIDTVIEKPTPTEAEQRLVVTGLRAGHYLCFFGMHVLTPAVMDFLATPASAFPRRSPRKPCQATTAIPGPGARQPPLRYWRALWTAYRTTGAGAKRARSRRGAIPIGRTAGHRMSRLTAIITAADPAIRNCSMDAICRVATLAELQSEAAAVDRFRRASDNLYERVRALFFLYAIHRFHLPFKPGMRAQAPIPFNGYEHLLKRRFEEAIDIFLAAAIGEWSQCSYLVSALSAAYHGLGFQTLAGQVRRSVRTVRGNQWMFRTGHPADYPLRLRPELLEQTGGLFPILRETTPVRMDLTHSGWSDIFFLGMDYPEGARVLNVSIDLSVRGAGSPKPPVEAWFRVIDEPVLRLASVDLEATAEITSLAEVFDFARDYLGLLKAAVISSGIVPPGMEGAGQPLADILAILTGRQGHGIEIVSRVNDIPKGSRLAVSTNLLASLISVCMRATGQSRSLTGPLGEPDQAPGGGAGHTRRVAGRFRRRLAGFRWRMARDETDRRSGHLPLATRNTESAAVVCCPAIASSMPMKFPPKHGRICRPASCWCMAAWRRMLGRFSKWSPRSICCAQRLNGRDASRPCERSTRSWDTCAPAIGSGRRSRHPAQLRRSPIPDHHSVGVEPVYGNADTPCRRGDGRGFLGLLDAGGNVRRRYAVSIFDLSGEAAGRRASRSHHERRPSAAWSAPCAFAMEPVVYDFGINERGTVYRRSLDRSPQP